jgi:predicted TIM-barrel fold metal-dependent hydrolase
MSFPTDGSNGGTSIKSVASGSSRRRFFASLAAMGAAACSSRGAGEPAAAAQSKPPLPTVKGGRRIDVHHHYGPPAWIKILTENKAVAAQWKDWSVARSIEDMDKAGVQTSMSSITTPGVYFAEGFGNGAAPNGKVKNDVRALARECNEYGARMKADHPGRFGIWASLPLPDVDASLKEIEYALDTLKCDGICVLTSIGSKYPGDKSFAPVFEELNRRKAILYTHPQVGPCCRNLVPIADNKFLGPTTLEYSQDTARAIASWVDSGSAARFPDIPVIFSHGGGNIWGQRFVSAEIGSRPSELGKDGKYGPKLTILRRFYYDIAQISHFVHLQNLKTLVGTSQILLGSDYPYGQPAEYVQDVIDMVGEGIFTPGEEVAIGRGNALRLLPHLNTAAT